MAIDTGKLHEFLGKFVTDLGATTAAGTRFRRAAETPFNLVYEVRP